MSSCEKENVITGVLKNKVNKLFRKSTTDGTNKKKEAKNAELLTLETELEEQKAANIELNEQVEEQTRAIETMKYQFAMLKQLKWTDKPIEGGSSTDDHVYGLLNGMRLADAENEAFNLRKKVEILKEEFDAIDTIKNEKTTVIEENSELKKEIQSLNDKLDEFYVENQMLNSELGEAEMTVDALQEKVNELEEQIVALKNEQEPSGSGNIMKHEENSGPPN